MLIQFSIKNFMSIKEKVTFSMIAGSGDENIENIINPNSSDRLLKSTAIYGANASGKTNFIRAFTNSILTIRKSNIRQVNEKLLEMIPFKFDNETKNKPCEFEFMFIFKDIKYVYGFSADINKVYDEYLYKYSSAKSTMIFDRTDVKKYKFIQADRGKLKDIETKNTDNKLFLATATAWNYEKTKDAYTWFSENIDTYDNFLVLNDMIVDRFEKSDKNGLREFTIKLLKEADIIIKGYNFESNSAKGNNPFTLLINNMPVTNDNVEQKEIKISTVHEVESKDGKLEEFNLDLFEESLGTQSLFFLSPILKDAFEKGKTIVVDEIDKSFHPLLVEYIIKLFHNTELNTNNAQIIFNTHDTHLLNLNLFRREQIWFVEKDYKKGATDLYPLEDFSVRKTENIQKGYLNGRYGAIPFIAMGDSLWTE
ncbi:MAG: ATP-binding protein [Oscillospiraceae bacterium]|nr:ATP-binding protein [Oscillospiraceae bacterium]